MLTEPVNSRTLGHSQLILGPDLPGQEKLVLRQMAFPSAPSTSKTVALGSNGTGKQIPRTGAENQHHSKSSHLVRKTSAELLTEGCKFESCPGRLHSARRAWR